ncbi:MAG: hypothetical protein KME03_18305 [Aphanocapsa lilacina HA4352-LM1]|jgi:hypothetical protein|nr:hypothetical protein [Aphanocapsa lilacina HA4352-LM1]
MKLILPREIAERIGPQLPAAVQVVHLQDDEADGDLADAKAHLYWWSQRRSELLGRILAAAPALRWVQLQAEHA